MVTLKKILSFNKKFGVCLLLFIYGINIAKADFRESIPTLDELYAQNPQGSSIESAYDLVYSEVTNPSDIENGNYDFTFVDSDLVTKYFNFTYNLRPISDELKLTRMNGGNGGVDVTGYFIQSGYYSISEANGGAINNKGAIGNITADFISNYLYSSSITSPPHSFGGAIFNSGTIGNITGDFIKNYASSTTSNSNGGAIFNSGGSIGNITGDFIGNYSTTSSISYGGAIYNTDGGSMGNITGDFIGNYVYSSVNDDGNPSLGGAILNDVGTISNITGDFIGNYVYSSYSSYGGAIVNIYKTIENITGDFIGNYATTTSTDNLALGGAIHTFNNMSFSADGKNTRFSGNYTEDNRGRIYNAIFVSPEIYPDITLSFKLSNAGSITINDQVEGGTVVNNTSINYNNAYNINILGDGSESAFNVNNSIINAKTVNVKNTTLSMGSSDVNGSMTHGGFVGGGNTASKTDLTLDHATLDLNYNGYQALSVNSLTTLNGSQLSFGADFANSLSDSITSLTVSGDIGLKHIRFADAASVGDRVTLFNNQYLNVNNLNTFELIYDGYVYKFSQENGDIIINSVAEKLYPIHVMEEETVDFQSTDVSGETGGVFINDDTLTITDSTFDNNNKTTGDGGVLVSSNGSNTTIVDSNFTNNSTTGLGGAIYGGDNIFISAVNNNITLSNNQDQSGSNDIYMGEDATLTLGSLNGNNVSINSGINGADGGYNIVIDGDGESSVDLNALASNVNNLQLSGGVLNLGDESYINNANVNLVQGELNISNGSFNEFNINNLLGGSGTIKLDVDPSQNISDILNVSGDLSGDVKLVINSISPDDIEDKILFAYTLNDDLSTSGSFEIERVIGSSFTWDTLFDESDMSWSFIRAEDGSYIMVTPETMGYLSLHSAAYEQTRSMLHSVKSKVSNAKSACGRCGVYDVSYDNGPLSNAWVNPIYYSSHVKSPSDLESDIWGLEAGFDIQRNANNKLGLFVSYRRGDYDVSGRGDVYSSNDSSDIDISSYMTGLYYRYDYHNFWLFSSIYGGLQKAEVSSSGVKGKSDGQEFGGQLELGYVYELNHLLNLEPTLGIRYSQLDFDRIRDNLGNHVKFDRLEQTELEAGLRLYKGFAIEDGLAGVYVKPSLIQVISRNDNIRINDLGKINSYNDGTLGRLELGGRYGLRKDLLAYSFINYTFGSEYNATSFGIGLNYSW